MSNGLLSLPIDNFIPEIEKHFTLGLNLVITAAPGAGKTTRLPPALAKICKGKVLVLEPRRMAAIAAAHRIADEQGWQVGEEIGYQVRFANKTSAKTKLTFMTEALLARQMIDDPELSDVELVILDEFHERSAHVDLALGLLKELQDLGRDIKILVMSATLEADKIASFLGGCPVIQVPGKLFELDVRHQKTAQVLQTTPNFYDQLFQTIKEAQNQTSHDILVFLPGVGEIDRTSQLIESWAAGKNIEVVPLHGSLNLDDQRKALQKSSRQRVILSTNIAESSVTIDGVNTVIDSGLAKNMKQDHRTGFSRLELGRISLSSAIQRAGRAARQFPGVSYRLWSKHDELAFGKSEVPEIQRIDLSESLLFLSAQGVSDFNSFSWFEKPTAVAIQSAIQFLKISGALNDQNQITELGRQMLHFPLPIRLAKLTLVGIEYQNIAAAAEMSALLQERDILRRDGSQAFLGDNLESDLAARLEVLEQFRKSKRVPRESSFMALQTVDQSARQIEALAQKLAPKISKKEKTDDERLLLAKTFADRLCRRRGKSERALMVGGRGVKLSQESLVKTSEFFVALNGMDADAETTVSIACGFDKNFILETFKSEIEKIKDITFIEEKGQFFTREYRSLYGLALDDPSLTPASSQDIADQLPQILATRFDMVLKSNEDLARWWARLEFLKRHDSQFAFETKSLIQEAFTQAAMGETKMQTVMEKDLVFFFENVFPADTVQTLRKDLPDKIEVPSGSKIQVHYPEDKNPYLEVRIQEVFGMMQTPKVLNGKLPVTFHLLGPNFRPVQVTSDLESFWKNGYSEVRKELRLKYPKHQWPEDPADGTPEAKGRRRQ